MLLMDVSKLGTLKGNTFKYFTLFFETDIKLLQGGFGIQVRVPLGIEEVNNDIGKGNGQNNNNNIDVIENEKIQSHNKCAVIQESSEASC